MEEEGEQEVQEGAGPRTPVTHPLSHGMQKPLPLTQMEGEEPPTLSWFCLKASTSRRQIEKKKSRSSCCQTGSGRGWWICDRKWLVL